jgi:hypothetical protein
MVVTVKRSCQINTVKQSLLAILNAAAAQASSLERFGVPVHEIINAALCRERRYSDIPPVVLDWLRKTIEREVHNLRRQRSRETRRTRVLPHIDAPGCRTRQSAPPEEASHNEEIQRVRALAHDDFEIQIVDVLLGLHPRCRTLRDLAHATRMSAGHTSRRGKAFVERAVRYLSGTADTTDEPRPLSFDGRTALPEVAQLIDTTA